MLDVYAAEKMPYAVMLFLKKVVTPIGLYNKILEHGCSCPGRKLLLRDYSRDINARSRFSSDVALAEGRFSIQPTSLRLLRDLPLFHLPCLLHLLLLLRLDLLHFLRCSFRRSTLCYWCVGQISVLVLCIGHFGLACWHLGLSCWDVWFGGLDPVGLFDGDPFKLHFVEVVAGLVSWDLWRGRGRNGR